MIWPRVAIPNYNAAPILARGQSGAGAGGGRSAPRRGPLRTESDRHAYDRSPRPANQRAPKSLRSLSMPRKKKRWLLRFFILTVFGSPSDWSQPRPWLLNSSAVVNYVPPGKDAHEEQHNDQNAEYRPDLELNRQARTDLPHGGKPQLSAPLKNRRENPRPSNTGIGENKAKHGFRLERQTGDHAGLQGSIRLCKH